MEEKVKDIYENIKDRLSNPLIFSFLCSWLVLNWKIPVALIWYDKSQFSGCGCHTIFDFIDWEWKNNGTFILPFIIAVVYTAAIPFIKNSIRIISAYAQKWGENEEIKALKGGGIGIDKYLRLREDYKNRIDNLETIVDEEKKYINENITLVNDLSKVRDDLNMLTIENNRLKSSISDLSILNGRWKFSKSKSLSYDKGEFLELVTLPYELIIKDGKCFVGVQQKFIITDFFRNPTNGKIFFNKILMDTLNEKGNYIFQEINFINKLNFNESNKDILEGTENGVEVKYERL